MMFQRGFVPTRRDPFVLAKGLKAISARPRPLRGNFATAPNYRAAQLASLKQTQPEKSDLIPQQSHVQGAKLNREKGGLK